MPDCQTNIFINKQKNKNTRIKSSILIKINERNGHFLEKNIISSFLFWADCEYHLTSYAGVSADIPADYLLGNRNYGKIMNRPAMLNGPKSGSIKQ